MKISTTVPLALVISSLACSGSSPPKGGSVASLDCSAICTKAKQCNPNVLVDVCQADCKATGEMLVESARLTVST
jgi:hypothetical protein